MALETGDDDGDDVRARVLQNTLNEITPTSPGGTELCCVICLDSVSEPCVARPCSHRNFDFLCLISWLETKNICPLCKSVVTEVHHNFSADGERWKVYQVPLFASRFVLTSRGFAVPRTAEEVPRGRTLWPYARRAIPRPLPSQSTPTSSSPHQAVLRRRRIYRHQLYSLHVGSNRMSRYINLTPELFTSDPDLVSRARMWIRRELQVFEYLSTGSEASGNGSGSGSAGQSSSNADADAVGRRRANNAEFLLEYIIAILKTVDIQGSCGEAEDMLAEFLGREHTKLFLHELRAWLRSPYSNLDDWDRNVQYPAKPPGQDLPEIGFRNFIRDPPRTARRDGASVSAPQRQNRYRFDPLAGPRRPRASD